MPTLCLSLDPQQGRPGVSSFHHDLDAEGEREAAALDWFALELGVDPAPMPRCRAVMLANQEAARRGLPEPKHPVYRKGYRRFEEIANGIGLDRPIRLSDTRGERAEKRQRTARARVHAIARLIELRKIASRRQEPVTIAEAQRLSGLSGRTLSRARKQGYLSRHRRNGGPGSIALPELARFLSKFIDSKRIRSVA